VAVVEPRVDEDVDEDDDGDVDEDVEEDLDEEELDGDEEDEEEDPGGRVMLDARDASAPRSVDAYLGAGSVLAGTMAVEKPDILTVRPTAGPFPNSCFRTMGPSTITRLRLSLSMSL
jgi:hypothetical protein